MDKIKVIDHLIVGAGPAGLNAAIAFAKNNKECVLVDENPKIGGLTFRHSSRDGKSPLPNDIIKKRWLALEKRYNQYADKIKHIANTEVVKIESGEKKVAFFYKDTQTLEEFVYKNIIICTGCHERSQPFPGWTLPGIMGVGGFQMQIKQNYIKPGNALVLVGTGPLLLLTAYQLTYVGVKVLGVFEAGRRLNLIGHFWNLLQNTNLVMQGLKYLSYLKKHKVPVYYGWGVVSAQGNDSVETVTLAPYDTNWLPEIEKSKTIKVDGVGVSYGFVSRNQLAYMADVDQAYNKNNGGFRATTNEFMRTSNESIYVAGDCVGVRGSEMAELEGALAANAVMIDNNVLSMDTGAVRSEVNALHRKIGKIASFHKALDAYSALCPGIHNLPDDDTLICRCENVYFKKIKEIVNEGVPNIVTLKMETRAGMGDCQGKTCSSFVGEYLSYMTNLDPLDVGCIHPRFPIVPLQFGTLAKKKDDEQK